jgi:hypothetical protein
LATTLTKPQVVINQTKAQLEENIESITEGALPPYLKSMLQNIKETLNRNIKLSTIVLRLEPIALKTSIIQL